MNILRVKRKALELLGRIDEDNSYLHLLLQQEANAPTQAPEEYPVLVQLVRGVLEQRTALDDALSPLLPKGLSSLPKPVQDILRLGAYQILFLDRVKKRDVVFEAVELAKNGPCKGLAKLVNAVLRRVNPLQETLGTNPPAPSSCNFPEWLVARWQTQFGEEEIELFCDANNKPLPLYLRVNTLRTTRESLQIALAEEGVMVEISALSKATLKVLRLPKDRRVQHLKSYQEGLFFIQDLSSTIVGDIVASDTPGMVWDLCAAPGGKSCSIALSIQGAGGVVFASDRTETRVGLIEEGVERLGLPNVRWAVCDALEIPSSEYHSYDAVLVDAPCSGFGTLGRKIDARWSKSEAIIEELTLVQTKLLSAAAALVRPAGTLVYSTCTIEQSENEQIIDKFIRAHPEFSVEPLSEFLPSELCTLEGYYRSWPHRHSMAGAFAAKLRRRAS